jgi:hypothetical protein
MTDKLRSLLVPVLAALVAAGAVFILMNRNGDDNGTASVVQDSGMTENANPLIVGYATEGVTPVTNDPDEFNKAVEKAFREAAEKKSMSLKYRYDATSSDGVHFDCLLANSPDNDEDMFIAIYTDETFEDELFLSELLRPGTAFEHITLNRQLDKGVHNVVAAFTLVKTEDGQQSITQQQFIGLRFTVK